MEGGNANSNMMMENNGLIYPMIMVPPFTTTTSDYHNKQNNSNNNNNNNNGSATINQHHHNNNNNNKFCCSSSSSSSSLVAAHQNQSHSSHYNLIMEVEANHHQQQQHSPTDNNGMTSIKSKIMSHPHYSRLLSAYLNCQKVGAPPEVVARLEEAEAIVAAHGGGRGGGGGGGGFIGEDPALDQFMEAYCEMLTKYEQELTKPFKEAMLFLSRIESQFKALTISSSSHHSTSACGEGADRNGSSEEDIDINNNFIDPTIEDRELKGQLLRKYSGYLGSLRQEFLKKRKKGKLPKEARQQLLDWWSRHYKWPYPSESQKLALAESTGLDQKQINNWFINQRKRHWKPSEDMQFVVMDAAATHAHPHPHYNYMDNILGNPFSMDVSPTLM